MTSPFKTKKPASVTEIPEAAKTASSNFTTEKQVGMTFNMPASWHRQFKMTAAQEGISMHELFVRSFDAYKNSLR